MPSDPTPLLTRVSIVPVLIIERVEEAVLLARTPAARGLPLIEGALRSTPGGWGVFGDHRAGARSSLEAGT